MVDFEKKLIYIHIPKTGGTAIEAAMLHRSLAFHEYGGQRAKNIKANRLEINFPPNGNPHSSLNEVLKAIKNPEEFTIFTTVRNPWCRFASMYRYHCKIQKKNWKLNEYFNRYKLAFDNYTLDKVIGEEHIKEVIFLRQENLQEDFSNMLLNLGLEDIELPLVNVTSKGSSYRDLLKDSEYIINHIKEVSKLDIDLFNYKY